MSPRRALICVVLAGLMVSACGTLQYREGRGCASRDETRCRIGAN